MTKNGFYATKGSTTKYLYVSRTCPTKMSFYCLFLLFLCRLVSRHFRCVFIIANGSAIFSKHFCSLLLSLPSFWFLKHKQLLCLINKTISVLQNVYFYTKFPLMNRFSIKYYAKYLCRSYCALTMNSFVQLVAIIITIH